MGNNVGSSRSLEDSKWGAEVKLANTKFRSDELQVLKSLFKNLAERSPGKTIDKRTFLSFFPLPGLLGERVWATFDKKQNNVVDYDEFLIGLACFSRGNAKEKAKFLFSMYDLAGDGSIHKEELQV